MQPLVAYPVPHGSDHQSEQHGFDKQPKEADVVTAKARDHLAKQEGPDDPELDHQRAAQ